MSIIKLRINAITSEYMWVNKPTGTSIKTKPPQKAEAVYESKYIYAIIFLKRIGGRIPDSKVHGDNMGSTWVLSAPDGPHVGPMNLAIRDDSSIALNPVLTSLLNSKLSATRPPTLSGSQKQSNLNTSVSCPVHSQGKSHTTKTGQGDIAHHNMATIHRGFAVLIFLHSISCISK